MRTRLGFPLNRFLWALALASLTAVIVLPGQRNAYAAPPPPSEDLANRVNRARSEVGLPSLTQDTSLDALASERSGDMASRRYFSHTTPDGEDIFTLMRERGIDFETAGENLAWAHGNQNYSMQNIANLFLESPPHRDNILNPAFNEIGVGVASEDGSVYVTVVLRG